MSLYSINISYRIKTGLLWWLRGKGSACQCRRRGFNPWAWKIPWRRKWLPTPVFLPRQSHGRRSLAGFSPWRCKRVKHDLVTKQQQTIEQFLFIQQIFIAYLVCTVSLLSIFYISMNKIYLYETYILVKRNTKEIIYVCGQIPLSNVWVLLSSFRAACGSASFAQAWF